MISAESRASKKPISCMLCHNSRSLHNDCAMNDLHEDVEHHFASDRGESAVKTNVKCNRLHGCKNNLHSLDAYLNEEPEQNPCR
jgi:hypothetical protein